MSQWPCLPLRVARSGQIANSGATVSRLAIVLLGVSSFGVLSLGNARAEDGRSGETPGHTSERVNLSVSILRASFAYANDPVLRADAACYLARLDYRQGLKQQLVETLSDPRLEITARIGFLAALARLEEHDRDLADGWLSSLRQVALDDEETQQVRVAAFVHLARLPRQGFTAQELGELQRLAEFGSELGIAVRWAMGSPGQMALAEAIKSGDSGVRRIAAAWAMSLASLTDEVRIVLRDAANAANPDLELVAAALFHLDSSSNNRAECENWRRFLTRRLSSQTRMTDEAYRVLPLLAQQGEDWEKQLWAITDARPTRSQLAAAYSICRLERRRAKRLTAIDWMVVAGYAALMLGVGVFYALRTRTQKDYLLGGGQMSPWLVGLSLFATMLSTLSYLAWPGEMIKHGPMVLMGYLAYPLIYGVVGWLLIPRFMTLQVTSAYELLEHRFGDGMRRLGSLLFLSLRFLWMASIIHWTTAIVLIPASGIDARYTTLIAALIGLFTVAYTSLGGLRAVVLTDAIQTLILFSGAFLSIFLITRSLGGVAAWLPQEWAPHWSPPKLWFDSDPSTRATLANAMLGTFCWYVCTAGSDQMAIQRYLATRDVRSARRSFAISLMTDCIVVIFLGLMGCALLAYFSARPDRLPDGASLFVNADKLFPHFVVAGLPVGFSGLVIAGLLAAAMSSLSSGINSSAAVISSDWLRRDRMRRDATAASTPQKNTSTEGEVSAIRWVSIIVGVAVVLLSTLIGKVQGNMLEVVYKVVNLFTAPLFYLFFMAMFVPFATRAGTFCGSAAGIMVAVLIAFWKDLTGVDGISFLWILPGAFGVSVIVGCGFSAVLARLAAEGENTNESR